MVSTPTKTATSCYHCGLEVKENHIKWDEKSFCCEGCKTVYEILNEHEMCKYYDLESQPGIQLQNRGNTSEFEWLDNPEISKQLLVYADEKIQQVRFSLPQIHCSSCIWLLENLHKLQPGIVRSRVDFLKKNISLTFSPEKTNLRELVELLASIGYEPALNLGDLQTAPNSKKGNPLLYQLGVAGFCLGNIMLLSFPEYLSWESVLAENYQRFFGVLNIILAIPVLLFSAKDFFRNAWHGLKQQQLNIDVPVSLGITVLFIRSVVEIAMEWGAGYLDSLVGLVFFLLIGKWFQQKTYDSLSFDRDYTSYFPIAATRLSSGKEEKVPVNSLEKGDRLRIHHKELIPGDAILISEKAEIDFSFVTGEADSIPKSSGQLIYAGGRQMGSAIEVELIKPVSQSYLTELWNHESFHKDRFSKIRTLTDRISERFTAIILGIAVVTGCLWWLSAGAGAAANVFTAVLIIACPCGLALTLPITLGSIMRLLGRNSFYLKNTHVIEEMANVSHIVFDKTGTLTQKKSTSTNSVLSDLTEEEAAWVYSLSRNSLHPISQSISFVLKKENTTQVSDFQEVVGSGIKGLVEDKIIQIGQPSFVGILDTNSLGKGTFIRIDKKVIGPIESDHSFRKGLSNISTNLAEKFNLSILSGDNDRQEQELRKYFPTNTEMVFGQTPEQKLQYIEKLQHQSARVMMIGDGLNDAGALQQAEVGVAISEDVEAFSPACDGILDARQFHRLPQLLAFSTWGMRLVKWGFVLSLCYNIIGLFFAVQGILSPVVAAILMPLSSLSVIVFGLGSTNILAWKMGLNKGDISHSS